ncbi:unnamed protein product [Gordionus sp. m RMFG-2023]|uniref:uncharacterized protein LOC135924448 n=1 Tax=Gordionus sp. m RMFG-2023 TaxID=3053472 RepID=UPI0030E1D737
MKDRSNCLIFIIVFLNIWITHLFASGILYNTPTKVLTNSDPSSDEDYTDSEEYEITGVIPIKGPYFSGATGWSHLRVKNSIYLFTWSSKTIWISKMEDSEDDQLKYELLLSEDIGMTHQIKGYMLHDRIYLAIIRIDSEYLDSISASYLCLFEPGYPIKSSVDPHSQGSSNSKLSIIQSLPTHGKSHLELFSKNMENFLTITNLEITDGDKHDIEFVIYKWDHAHMDVLISRECINAIRNKVFTIDGTLYLFILQEKGKDGDPEVGSPLYMIDFVYKKSSMIQILQTNSPTDVSYIERNGAHYLIITNSDGYTDIWGWMYGNQFVKYQSLYTPKPVKVEHFFAPNNKMGLIILDSYNSTLKIFSEKSSEPQSESETTIFDDFIEREDLTAILSDTYPGHPYPSISYIDTIQTEKSVYFTVATLESISNYSNHTEKKHFHSVFKLRFETVEKTEYMPNDTLILQFKNLFEEIQSTLNKVTDINFEINTILQKTLPQNITKDVIINGDLIVNGTIKIQNLVINTNRTEFPIIDISELDTLTTSAENYSLFFDDILLTNQPNQTLNGEFQFLDRNLTISDEFNCPSIMVEGDVNGIFINELDQHCLMSPNPTNPHSDQSQVIKGIWTVPQDKKVFASFVNYTGRLNNLTPLIASTQNNELVFKEVSFEKGLYVKELLELKGTLNGLDDFSPTNIESNENQISVKAKKILNGNLRIIGNFEVVTDVNKNLNINKWMKDTKFLTIEGEQSIKSQITFDAPTQFEKVVFKTVNDMNMNDFLNNIVPSNGDYQVITGRKTFTSDVTIAKDALFTGSLNNLSLDKDFVIIRENPSIFRLYAFVFTDSVSIEKEINVEYVNGRNFSDDVLTKNSIQRITGKWRFLNDVTFMGTTQIDEYKNAINVDSGVKINGVDLSETIPKLAKKQGGNRFKEEVTFHVDATDIEGNITINEEKKINDHDIIDITDIWTLTTDQMIPIQNLNILSKIVVNDKLICNRVNGFDVRKDFVNFIEPNHIKGPVSFSDKLTVNNLMFNGHAKLNGIQPNSYLNKVIYVDSNEPIIYINGDIVFAKDVTFHNDVRIEKSLNGHDLYKDFLLNGTVQELKASHLKPDIMVVVGDMVIQGGLTVIDESPGTSIVQGYELETFCNSIVHPSNPFLVPGEKNIPIRGKKIFITKANIESLVVTGNFNDINAQEFQDYMENAVLIDPSKAEVEIKGAYNLTFEGKLSIEPTHTLNHDYHENSGYGGIPNKRKASSTGIKILGKLITPIQILAVDSDYNKDYDNDKGYRYVEISNFTRFLELVITENEISGGNAQPYMNGLKSHARISGKKIFLGPVTFSGGLNVGSDYFFNGVDLNELKNSLLDIHSEQTLTSKLNFEKGVTIKNLIIQDEQKVKIFGQLYSDLYKLDLSDAKRPSLIIDEDVIFENDVEFIGKDVYIEDTLNGIPFTDVLVKLDSTSDVLIFDKDQEFEDLLILGDIKTHGGVNGIQLRDLQKNSLMHDIPQVIEDNWIFNGEVSFGENVLFNNLINENNLTEFYENALLRNNNGEPQVIHGDLTIIGSDQAGQLTNITVNEEFSINTLNIDAHFNGYDLNKLTKNAVHKKANPIIIITSNVVYTHEEIHFKKGLDVEGHINGAKFPEDFVPIHNTEDTVYVPGHTIILNSDVRVLNDIEVEGKINDIKLVHFSESILNLEEYAMELTGVVKFYGDVIAEKDVIFFDTVNDMNLSQDLVLKHGDFDITGEKHMLKDMTLNDDIYGTCRVINGIDLPELAEVLVRKRTNATLNYNMIFKKSVEIKQNVQFRSLLNGLNINGLENIFEDSLERLNKEMDTLSGEIKYHDLILDSQIKASLRQPAILAYWEISQTWPEMTETFRYDFLSYYDTHFIYKWVHNGSGCHNLPKECRCDQMELLELTKDGALGDREILGHFRDFPMSINLQKFDSSQPQIMDYKNEKTDSVPNIMLIVSSRSISYSKECTTKSPASSSILTGGYSVNQNENEQMISKNIENNEQTIAYLLGDFSHLKKYNLPNEEHAKISYKIGNNGSEQNNTRSFILRGKTVLSTKFVSDAIYFYRNHNLYIVIVNYFDKALVSHNVDSYIYKFDTSVEDWVRIQSIPTHGAISGTLFVSSIFKDYSTRIHNNLYLAIANMYDSVEKSYSTHSFIYKWDDEAEQFNPIMSVHTETAKDVVSMTIKQSGYVIFANEKTSRSHEAIFNNEYQEPITVFYHDPKKDKFVRIQDHYIPGVSKLDTFIINDNYYLAAVSPVENKIFIYKWREYLLFTLEMEIPNEGCKSIHTFWDRGNLYMAIGNIGSYDQLLIAKIRGNKDKEDLKNLKRNYFVPSKTPKNPYWVEIDNDIKKGSGNFTQRRFVSPTSHSVVTLPQSTPTEVSVTSNTFSTTIGIDKDIRDIFTPSDDLHVITVDIVENDTTTTVLMPTDANISSIPSGITQKTFLMPTDTNISSIPSEITKKTFLPTISPHIKDSLTTLLSNSSTIEIYDDTITKTAKYNITTQASSFINENVTYQTLTDTIPKSDLNISTDKYVMTTTYKPTDFINMTNVTYAPDTTDIYELTFYTDTEEPNNTYTSLPSGPSSFYVKNMVNHTVSILTNSSSNNNSDYHITLPSTIPDSSSDINITFSITNITHPTTLEYIIDNTTTLNNSSLNTTTYNDILNATTYNESSKAATINVPVITEYDYFSKPALSSASSSNETENRYQSDNATTTRINIETHSTILTMGYVQNQTDTTGYTDYANLNDTLIYSYIETMYTTPSNTSYNDINSTIMSLTPLYTGHGILPELLNKSGLLDEELNISNFHFLNQSGDHLKKFLPKNISDKEVETLIKGIEEELVMDYEHLKHTSAHTKSVAHDPYSTKKITDYTVTEENSSTTPFHTIIPEMETISSSTENMESTRKIKKTDMSKLKPGGAYFSRNRNHPN